MVKVMRDFYAVGATTKITLIFEIALCVIDATNFLVESSHFGYCVRIP